MKGLQQPGASVIPKQIGVAHVRLQHVHRFVPRHVAHLEHGSAAAGCAGQEADAQGVGPAAKNPPFQKIAHFRLQLIHC